MSGLLEVLKSPWAIGCYIFGAGCSTYLVVKKNRGRVEYDEIDLSGKTYIVSGATSGIGKQVAHELAKRSARVIMACRDRKKCVSVRRDIVLNTNNRQVYCRHCDLTDSESVRNFVAKVSKGKFKLDRIDGVLLNAATMEPSRNVNKEGIEVNLVTNCIGPFLLTGLLLDKLLLQQNPVRIVFVSTRSICNKCEINFEDFNFENRGTWFAFPNYKETKLAQTLFAKELSDRIKDTNLSVLVVDPGQTKTNLTAKLNAQKFFLSRWLLKPISYIMGEQRVEAGVVPVLYALLDKDMEKKSGVFIDREKKLVPWCDTVLNDAVRKRLWMTCAKWSHLDEHFGMLRKDLKEDGKVLANSSDDKKRARYFWFF